LEGSSRWEPGKIDISNKFKWNNITYPTATTTTPLSCQVDEQQINNVEETKKKTKGTSAVYDTGATSTCGMVGDNFEATDEISNKIFCMPTGDTTPASTIAKLHYDVRKSVRTVDMVPALKHNSLISGPKFAEANYITVLTPTGF
jgi:hypothetical protein